MDQPTDKDILYEEIKSCQNFEYALREKAIVFEVPLIDYVLVRHILKI